MDFGKHLFRLLGEGGADEDPAEVDPPPSATKLSMFDIIMISIVSVYTIAGIMLLQ